MDLIRESSLFQSLTQQSREEAREEGLEEGRERGLEQGLKRGERDRAIADILDVLEVRFDLPASHPLSARIAAIEDLQRLKQVLRSAVQVSSLEAFEHILDDVVL